MNNVNTNNNNSDLPLSSLTERQRQTTEKRGQGPLKGFRIYEMTSGERNQTCAFHDQTL